MRAFDDIRGELGLDQFLDAPESTLYYVPDLDGPMVMVRHFDSSVLPPGLVEPCAQLNAALAAFVAARPALAAWVEVPQPLEVGHDFISRRFFSYGHSTMTYDDGEAEPPEELAAMRAAVRAVVEDVLGTADARDRLLATLLGRCLLEPSGKVYFDGARFVVIEPHLVPDQMREWARLSHP